jgi:hypothetical protein
MTFVLISGKKFAGKDTVAEYMEMNHAVHRIALADPLKDLVAKMYNRPRIEFDDQRTKEVPIYTLPVIPRDDACRLRVESMMSEFRTRDGYKPAPYPWWRRMLGMVIYRANGQLADGEGHGLYWTNRALCILEGFTKRCVDANYWTKQALDRAHPNKLNVFSDVRFENEVVCIRRHCERVVVVRVERPGIITSNDASETSMDHYKFDYIITNNGSLKELYEKVETMFTATKL